MRVSYHCRFLKTGTVMQLHCQSFIQPDKIQFNQHYRFVAQANSDLGHYCRFMARTDSDGFIITAGS
jgi:hypothetical protein